jgi:hypothetical protein
MWKTGRNGTVRELRIEEIVDSQVSDYMMALIRVLVSLAASDLVYTQLCLCVCARIGIQAEERKK